MECRRRASGRSAAMAAKEIDTRTAPSAAWGMRFIGKPRAKFGCTVPDDGTYGPAACRLPGQMRSLSRQQELRGGAMRNISWWLAGLCSASVLAAGSEDKQLSLTIYNRNLALVEHIR